jgi:DNA-binding XRE family transcriptional regulator
MKLSLKACRVNVKATAKEMGKAVGVSEDTVYNWEAGKYAPRRSQMPKILDFFAKRGMKVTLDDINFLP